MNTPGDDRGVGRREFLGRVAAASGAALLPGAAGPHRAADEEARPTLIRDENRKPGSLDWQLTSTPPGHTLPWSHWSRPHGPDERVQTITRNLLEQAIGRRSGSS